MPTHVGWHPGDEGQREIMNVKGSSLFCDTDLAARIERAEAQLIAKGSEAAGRRQADTAGFVIPVAGGVASYAEEGSPFNKVAGLGFDGVPTAAVLDELEEAFHTLGAPVQVELAHLVDPTIGARLSDRGYRLESFENVLGLALTGDIKRVTPPGVQVRPSGDDEFELWLDVVADAVAHPDPQGMPWREEFPREVYLRAERDAEAAGVTATSPCSRGPSPAVPDSASTRASHSSPGLGPHRRTGAAVSRPRCSPPGSPTPPTPAATSP
jgi:hypothetical protein